jgi:hypothetical protein
LGEKLNPTSTTERIANTVCISELLLPVIVRSEFTLGLFVGTVIVSVEVPDPAMLAGLNVAVAPVGSPVTVGVMVPGFPFIGVAVTV